MTTVARSAARAAWMSRNRTRLTVFAVLIFLFLAALGGLDREDWLITILRGLAVGAITFLVASGLSLIFGLMDVLNLAHGEIFMLGAYLGWTMYTRPDTVVDALVPLLLLGAPLVLMPWLRRVGIRIGSVGGRKVAAGGLIAAGVLGVVAAAARFPLVIWNPEVYTQSPITYSLAINLGTLAPLPEDSFAGSALLIMIGLVVASAVAGIGLQTLLAKPGATLRVSRGNIVGALSMAIGAILLLTLREPIVSWLFSLTTTWRFLLAIVVSVALGSGIGAAVEVTLIRPLYERPIYQLMITLGLGFVLIELVRSVWGRPEFNMPKPAAFAGAGAGCPAQGFGGLFSGCSTSEMFGGRVRTYNEAFVIAVGIVVLVGVMLILKRTRIGMIIRAGVQDREMVEALGINVRRVFTLVFAIGTGLAALGGVVAAPSMGLSPQMGGTLLLLALIALAIGGLSSFPGAAAGAVLVGLLQQFIIRYGQIGIDLPFMAEPFKPSPPLVPASTVLLMVVILLVLPNGLFGKSSQ